MKKRVLAIVLAALMLASLVPASAFAADQVTLSAAGYRYNISTSESTANYNTGDVMYVKISSGKTTDYVYTYAFGDGVEKDVKESDLLPHEKAAYASYARWHPQDLKEGQCTIKVYAKGADGEKTGAALGETSFTLFKFNLELGSGSTSGNAYVFAKPGDLVMYTVPSSEITPPADVKLIGWTTQSGDWDNDYTKILTYLPSTDSDGDNTVTLYACYGVPKVYQYKIYNNGQEINTTEQIEMDPTEAGYIAEEQKLTLTVRNTGNQDQVITPVKATGNFKTEFKTDAASADTASGSQSYFDKNGDIVLPVDGSFTIDITPSEGLGVGKYAGSVTLIGVTYRIIKIIGFDFHVTKGSVNLTLSDTFTKEYGQTLDVSDLSSGAQIEWTDASGKGEVPAFEELGITLNSAGLAAAAPVTDDGYAVTVNSSASNYEVIITGQSKVMVTKTTPVKIGDAQSTIKVNTPLSTTTPGVTYANPHTNEPVPGTLAWVSGEQQWAQAGEYSADYTFVPADENNYNAPAQDSVQVTVAEKDPVTLVADPATTNVTYDRTAKEVAFTADPASDITVEYRPAGTDGDEGWDSAAPVKAGSYEVRATVKETADYAPATTTATLIINPAPITVSFGSAAKEYDGTDTVDSITVDVTGVFEGDTVKAAAEGVVFADKNAGENKTVNIDKVTLSGDDADNYVLVGTGGYHAVGTITQAPVTIEVKGGIEKVYGTQITLTDNDFDVVGTLKGDDQKADLHVDLLSDGTETGASVGDYDIQIRKRSNENSNYDVSISGSASMKVTQAAPTPSVTVTAGSGMIGNQLSTVSLYGTFVNENNSNLAVAGDLEWTAPTTVLSGDDGSTIQCEWKFTPTGADALNYTEASGKVDVTLRAKEVPVVKMTPDAVIYNGQAQPVTVTLENAGGTPITTDAPAFAVSYRQRLQTADADSFDWSEEAPTVAGIYDVLVAVEENDKYAAENVIGTLVIAKATPDISSVTAKAVKEGSYLSAVELEPASPDGVPGTFVWDAVGGHNPDSVYAVEGQEYWFTFVPDDSRNYEPVHGKAAISYTADNRTIKAELYNLPDGMNYQDYAVVDIAASELELGEVIAFYKDADCTDLVSQPVTVTTADGKVTVYLDADALGDDAGTIYAKLAGKTTFKASELTYAKELGFTLTPAAISVEEEQTADVTVVVSDAIYNVSGAVWSIDGDKATVSGGSTSATVTGVAQGTAALTVTVTFTHPDPAKADESIVLTASIPVTVTEKPATPPVDGADYSAVDAALEKVPQDLSKYTEETVKALEEAVNGVVRGLPKDRQAEVDAMAQAIEDALAALEEIVNLADYTEVDAALEKANEIDRSKYTEDSLKALDEAISKVERGLPKDRQAEVDAMAKAIEDAMTGLVEKKPADYSAVDAALAKVPSDLSIYTDATVKTLQDAIKAVDRSLTAEDQDKVDAMAKAIESAIAGLVRKSTGGGGTGGTPGGGTTTRPGGSTTGGGTSGGGTSSGGTRFTDVAAGAYYYDAVQWAVAYGVTNGYTATEFAPNAACTRAQIVTFLWRASGSPKATSANNPFTDLDKNAYYYDAVLWAVEKGITNGYSATEFAPNETCTRAQIVTFLWRYHGKPAASGSTFSDVAQGSYYETAVKWAVANGVTNGYTATEFAPNVDCTRAQSVTFLYRDLVK